MNQDRKNGKASIIVYFDDSSYKDRLELLADRNKYPSLSGYVAFLLETIVDHDDLLLDIHSRQLDHFKNEITKDLQLNDVTIVN